MKQGAEGGPNVATALCGSLALGPGAGGGSHQTDPKCQLAVTSGREEPELSASVCHDSHVPFILAPLVPSCRC